MLFEDYTLFDLDLLDSFHQLIHDEDQRIENDIELDVEIFNHSNCQCENEHYEFVTERQMKKKFKVEFKDIGFELLIVGLYKQCEIYIKIIVDNQFPDFSRARKKKYCDLQKSLENYSAIDELRLINNCIKHEGKVSAPLAKTYSRWKQGDQLGDLSEVYKRLSQKIVKYIISHENYIKNSSS